MRIGFLCRNDVAAVNYRGVTPLQALERAGHSGTLVLAGNDGSVDLSALQRCDVVHVYRVAGRGILAAVTDLQRRGIAVTWDNDDDIRLVPAGSAQKVTLTKAAAERDFVEQMKVARRADLVTTTSEYLARCYREAGQASVVRIENYLHPDQLSRAPRSHEGLVIGWVAGLEHRADAQALGIAEVLDAVLARHPEVRVVSIGVDLGLRSDRYTHHLLVPFDELPDHIRQFDIGIAPLADLPMSYARSNVKVKEYAGAGVPWLASARGPYEGLGEREGGRLVGDDGWEAALEALIDSSWKRRRLRRRAEAWGKDQVIDRHVGEWAAAFERAMENAAERGSAAATA